MDKDLLLSKLESLRRCLRRVQDKTPPAAEILHSDPDVQDILDAHPHPMSEVLTEINKGEVIYEC